MAMWGEDVHKDSFKICLRETKILDGTHKNIKVVSTFTVNRILALRYRKNGDLSYV